MIKKILIANRGEIAARIIRTCQKVGIETVAIYSEADETLPYVKMADNSYFIGKPPVNESYMNIDKILAIAKEANVDAIHPGYGFFSENSSFAKKCEDNGFIFIGPSPKVIEQMGDKVKARQLMERAGVPIIPGSTHAIISAQEAENMAEEIGYPVMLKAAAGGGGIGMQVVNSPNALKDAFESNSSRAKNFFGDGSMFIEKKMDQVRHIEIQIIADSYGNVIHLFERECSIQRRNQKVIEEAPSPFISEDTRKAMGEAAIKAAKEINYQNAGTIEFLVDKDENFYFLEMNTRIQVEHPVTEQITGVDIAELQLLVANGDRLPITQEEITISGHAIQARVYAEDPQTFFPSPGFISKYSLPEQEDIRLESTVCENYQLTPFYDPMIAKVIATGKTRNEATRKLQEALKSFKIEGIKSNIPMIISILSMEAYIAGDTMIDFVDKYYIPTVSKQ